MIQEFTHVRARRRSREAAVRLAKSFAILLGPLVPRSLRGAGEDDLAEQDLGWLTERVDDLGGDVGRIDAALLGGLRWSSSPVPARRRWPRPAHGKGGGEDGHRRGRTALHDGLALFQLHREIGCFDAVLIAAARARSVVAVASADRSLTSVPGLRVLDSSSPSLVTEALMAR